MTEPSTKKKPAPIGRITRGQAPAAKPAAASRLRVQTRKLLGKHYRAKYGVR